MWWGGGPDRLLQVRVLPIVLLTVVSTAACTETGPSETTDTTEPAIAVPAVTEPAIRLTPFCQQMIALDEALPADPSVDTSEQVLEAYRAALPDVPAEIDAEFRAVIAALETGTVATVPGATIDTISPDDLGGPAETLPPDATVPPAPPSGSTTLPSDEQLVAEEGWLPDEEPAARVNAYIDFACRGTANNPGPPATEPGAVVPTSDGA
ncbi:hypothetical protein BDK89_2075 [Ilumatobacter fluminis]|uniref:Uncharacterized protein n=1 Tax=Ilumatobacter fluminis TaxID=467091 RepID=A0A4R7I097_9ACTN|nr:hypothetical protein BDK89_2075 [Ilumatobacter fluminis]